MWSCGGKSWTRDQRLGRERQRLGWAGGKGLDPGQWLEQEARLDVRTAGQCTRGPRGGLGSQGSGEMELPSSTLWIGLGSAASSRSRPAGYF